MIKACVALLLVVAASVAAGGCGALANENHPNVVFILTDDLDVAAADRMPELKSLLANRGTTFENAFVTNPICCPSRATIMRGQYSHNHGVLTNGPPQGGFEKFEELGRQKSTIATWLHDDGYRTALVGKYLNDTPPDYKPPGWDEVHEGGFNASGEYSTDWYSDRASGFIKDMKGERQPFFLYVATKAPHSPADPAPRHEDAFPRVEAPRPPSFNEKDVSDKPEWIREQDPLADRQTDYIDELHRKRLQSMLAVDEMIGRLVGDLRESGELDNTYFVFTSDNGWSQGEHRRRAGKGSAYEEDIRVPLIIRGPGVPEGKELPHMVLNNDFAPTFADLAGADAPSFVDGHSLMPLLTRHPTALEAWRQAFLVEGYQVNEKRTDRPPYKAVRTADHKLVEYKTGERELYDLDSDPYELRSQTDKKLTAGLEDRLAALRDCSGEDCRAAEGFPNARTSTGNR